jgi:hypothetical protein
VTDSTSTQEGGKSIAYQDSVRDIDAETTLGLDAWRPLPPDCCCISVGKPKSDQDMQQVAALWNGRREVALNLWGYSVQDFECLRHFEGLERLTVQAPIVKNIDGLKHVAGSLKEFSLANTTVRLSLRPVASCAGLKSLHLQRQTKDFGALKSLTSLEHLGISGVSLPDLLTLLPYEHLRSLFLGFCKPLKLDLLGHFKRLEALHLIKINNLHDLSALALGRTLKRIELNWLPHVETLPDLSELTLLEEVEIESMKSLRDVSSIAKAPALRFLGLWACSSLSPESFKCLIGHPTLKRLNYGIGRIKDNEVVERMFPEEMTQPVYAKIMPGTYLQRPTP